MRPLAVAFVAFLLAAVVAASVIWRMDQYRRQERRAIASDAASDHADGLQRNIERALSATYALDALVRQGNGTISNFDAVGRQMLPFYPGVSSFSLAPGGIISSVVPLAGNEKAIGQDLLNNPETKKEASIARESGKLALAGPFTLVQGETAVIGRLPVFLDDTERRPSFWGFINVVIRFPEVLETARLGEMGKQGFAYELWRMHPDSGRKQIIAASSSAALIDPVEQALQVPNATWTLSVMPVKGWGNLRGISLMVALGLLFSLLLAYVAKLLVDSKAHEKGLEALVAQRTAEVVAREADLNRAQSVARVGSWVLDVATRELRGSAEALRILGASGSGPINYKAFLRLVHPDDREAVDLAARASLKGEPHDIEYRILAGAATRWVHSIAELKFDADGRLSNALGTIQDITERKRTEDALRAAEEQFRGLVEQSIAGTYLIQDGRFAYVNPRFLEIFGYDSADELIGRDATSLVAEQDRGMVVENMRQRIEGEVATVNYSFTAVRKDGAMIDIGVHGTRATHGGRPAIIGLVQDISEKKRADEQIQRYLTQLETAFMSTVEVATTLSEMRDPYTAGHERRVGKIAVAIGAELGFDDRRIEGLRVAGYLHDIGKITIPAEILSKPGKLSQVEFQLVQGHAQASYDVLKDVEFPWPVAEVALQHHERMDGSGYPQGLKGEAILLEARIMAVADVIEAMSSHRPYRVGLGMEAALAEIERGRGSAYDADIAEACLRLFRERRYQLPA
jgi:PAS domain S-box-containing protein